MTAVMESQVVTPLPRSAFVKFVPDQELSHIQRRLPEKERVLVWTDVESEATAPSVEEVVERNGETIHKARYDDPALAAFLAGTNGRSAWSDNAVPAPFIAYSSRRQRHRDEALLSETHPLQYLAKTFNENPTSP